MNYKLGSLFDGSGGFPFAGALCGVEPVWAAEVEPYPIAVTKSRFPKMKHLGDISKVNGGEIEPVDIITFGSPCQDLSVAGKRAGLKHEANGDEETTRSGLFMEAVRIIKEMRNATYGKYPSFALWENVPGAFSSNKGEDLRIVLEELIKIVEPSAAMPQIPSSGWPYADSYVGDGWSIAYRVFDAQFWGVPQRRRRIHLVLDLRGQRAREILFEREGVRGYFEKGGTTWQTVAEDAERCLGADDSKGEDIKCFTPWDYQTRRCYSVDGVAPSLCAGAETSGQNQQSFCVPLNGDGAQIDTKTYAVDQGAGKSSCSVSEESSPTLACTHGGAPAVAYSFDSLASNSMKSSNPHSGCHATEVAKTLDTTDPNPSKNQGGIAVVEQVPYTLKVRSGCDVDSNGKAAGKGALIQTDKAATLSTVQDQYLFQPIKNTHIIDNIGGQAEYGKASLVNGTLRSGCQGAVAYLVTNSTEPNFIDVVPKDPVICLQGNGIDRADTAGCNGKGWNDRACYTLNTIDRPAVAYGIDRAAYNQGQNAKYDFSILEEQQPTLVARGPGATCHTIGLNGEDKVSPTLIARMSSAVGTTQDNLIVCEPFCKSGRARSADDATTWKEGKVANTLNTFDQGEVRANELVVLGSGQKVTGCLMASGYEKLGAQEMFSGDYTVIEQKQNYIVRRLTPTECARLQGFPDRWGDINSFDPNEWKFWEEVRNTHADINGKAVKEYTAKQMKTWYDKLHTDSAEYKMWGNGIALPPALYVLQGIVESMIKGGNDNVRES